MSRLIISLKTHYKPHFFGGLTEAYNESGLYFGNYNLFLICRFWIPAIDPFRIASTLFASIDPFRNTFWRAEKLRKGSMLKPAGIQKEIISKIQFQDFRVYPTTITLFVTQILDDCTRVGQSACSILSFSISDISNIFQILYPLLICGS